MEDALRKEKRLNEEILRQAYLGNTLVVESLLKERKTNVNRVCDKKQRHPLHFAASRGKADVIRILVTRYGADADVEDEDGKTPLHFAAKYGHIECLKALIQASAWADGHDARDETPLHLAARYNHADCCLLLLDAGSTGNARNQKGLTPIGEAVVAGSLETLEVLGNSNPMLLQDRPRGFTLLHLACGQGKAAVALYLIRKIPILVNDMSNTERVAPLHCAVMARSMPCVKALIDAGCQLNCTDSKDHMPIDLLEEEALLSPGNHMNDGELRVLLRSKSRSDPKKMHSYKNTIKEDVKPSIPFLEQLALQLQKASTLVKQQTILVDLAMRYSQRTQASDLFSMIAKGLDKAYANEHKSLLNAIVDGFQEIVRVRKGMEVIQTLKAAHEDDQLQHALHTSKVRNLLLDSRSRENLRSMLAEEDFGLTKEVQSKLHGLQIFFASRGFNSRGFAKDVRVEEGMEEKVKADDEARIEKLDLKMGEIVLSLVDAISKVSGSSLHIGSISPKLSVQECQIHSRSKALSSSSIITSDSSREISDQKVSPRYKYWEPILQQMILSFISLILTLVVFQVFKKYFTLPDVNYEEKIPDYTDGNDKNFDEL